MRSKLSAAVRRDFEAGLGRLAPQFTRMDGVRLPDEYLPFAWRVSDTLALFVLLHRHPTRDWFTVELGWSHTGEWGGFTPGAKPSVSFTDRHLTFRMSALWDATRDHWWELVSTPSSNDIDALLGEPPPLEAVLPRVAPAVADALERLVRFGFPYFTSVAAAANVTLDLPHLPG